jgi:glucose-6-phosphate 1-dehydrogenase
MPALAALARHAAPTGTRFVLRAGKALAERRKEIVVRFRSDHHDTLRMGIDGPRNLALRLHGAAPRR